MVEGAKVNPELQTEHWFQEPPVQVEQAPLQASHDPWGLPFLNLLAAHVRQALVPVPLQVRQLGSQGWHVLSLDLQNSLLAQSFRHSVVEGARVYPELQTEHWFQEPPVQVEQARLQESQDPWGLPFLNLLAAQVKQAVTPVPLQVAQLGSQG